VRVLLASLLAVVGLLSFSASAEAYAAPSGLESERFASVCPPRPAEYTGTDEATHQLVELRQAQSDGCVRGEQLAAQSHSDAAAVKAATEAATKRLGEALSVDVANEPTVKVSGGGGGGSSETRVVSFGPSAEATFSEGVERVEVLCWCIIGTIMAGTLFLVVRRLLFA
jgi:hypothetical protein